MTTWKFWRGALERAVKTFAQTLIALITAVEGFDLFSAEWPEILAAAGTAAVLSILTSIASLPVGEPNSASALPEPQ
jgi:hypothetical protein